jgi:hypothetical protein
MGKPENSRNVSASEHDQQSGRDERRKKLRSGILCDIEDATYEVLRKYEKTKSS